MDRIFSSKKTAICFSLSIVLALGNGPYLAMSAAAISMPETASATSRIDQYEKAVYGETHDKLSASTRVKDLEKTLFGTTHSGDVQNRLDEIGKALGAKKVDYLLPAIAPQMDTATSHDETASSEGSDQKDSQADREKSMLRQAMSLYQSGKTPEAERMFKSILAMDFRNADAYYNLGVIAEGKGDLNSALNNYKAASNINPNDSDLKDAINSVQNKIDQQESNNRIQAEQARQQQDSQKRQQLQSMVSDASAAYKGGNFDKAINELNSVAIQAPSDPDVQYALSQAYRGKGNIAAAKQALQRAIALNPNNSLYQSALTQLNQPSKAASSQIASEGMPPLAPPIGQSGTPGQILPYDSFNVDHPNSSTPVSYTDQGRAGQLTPFTDDSASTAWQSDRMRSGWQSGSVAFGGGYGYGADPSTRLRRVMIGGASGAAMGALFGSLGGGGGRGMMSGAMRGGLMGSMMGLIMGF
jgi:tetratricopeptide (TPR) repeat protein